MEYGFYLIPIVAIAGGITYAILSQYWKSKGGAAGPAVQKTLDDNLATNQAVLAKLDSIESRLQAVEKTLTDIPG